MENRGCIGIGGIGTLEKLKNNVLALGESLTYPDPFLDLLLKDQGKCRLVTVDSLGVTGSWQTRLAIQFCLVFFWAIHLT